MWTIKGITVFREAMGRPLEFRQKLQEKKRFILETHKNITFFGAIGSALPDHIKHEVPGVHNLASTTKTRFTDLVALQSICESAGFARMPLLAPDGITHDPEDFLYMWLKPMDTELVKDFYRDNVINDMDRGMPTGMPHDTAMSIQKNRDAEQEKRDEMEARKREKEKPSIDGLLDFSRWQTLEPVGLDIINRKFKTYEELGTTTCIDHAAAAGFSEIAKRYGNVPGKAFYTNIGYVSARYDVEREKMMFYDLPEYMIGHRDLSAPYLDNVHPSLLQVLRERAHLKINDLDPGKVYQIGRAHV